MKAKHAESLTWSIFVEDVWLTDRPKKAAGVKTAVRKVMGLKQPKKGESVVMAARLLKW